MNRDELVLAYLDDFNKILVTIDKIFCDGLSNKFHLICDDYIEELTVLEHNCDARVDYYYLEAKNEITIGKEYEVMVANARRTPLQYRFVTKKEQFDDMFYYANNDLGCTIEEQTTNFALWAPTASSVMLVLINDGVKKIYDMTRSDKGVYRISFNCNLTNCLYYYLVKVNGTVNETIDPYGKLTTPNSKMNVVNDTRLLKSNKVNLKELEKYSDAIIYETSVRDFTKEKTFVSLATHCDYLKELGITHLQLMPVNDFYSVDDYHKDIYYNWGYDPISYQCLENSYSSNILDPLASLEDFSLMINKLHSKGIKVNLDVVFNHIYSVGLSSFEKIVPYYYFRYKDGRLSNGTGCGNELDTEKSMVRKLIVDTLIYYVETFDVDGFRFDLMSFIDIDTINEITYKLKSIKKDIMLYGEGWIVDSSLESEKQTSINNKDKVKSIAFFNDIFRDTIKGATFNAESKGYATGDESLTNKAMECIQGLLYADSEQTINYVECHDNMTLFDKVRCCCKDASFDDIVSRIKLINGIVILSQGIPFISAGQEFCRSKQMLDNTYNATDKINNLNEADKYKYEDVIAYTKALIKIRKDYKLAKKNEDIIFDISLDNYNGLIVYQLKNCLNKQTITILINPTNKIFTHYFDQPNKLIFDGKERCDKVVHTFYEIDRLSIVILGSDIND